jgi:hypothetical protein
MIMSVSNPTLGDWCVIVDMVLLFIFSVGDEDLDEQLVTAMRTQLWTRLRRHLQNTMKTQASIDSTMAYVQYCNHTLPTILQLKVIWRNPDLTGFSLMMASLSG